MPLSEREAEHYEKLVEALGERFDLAEQEKRSLYWLAGWDDRTVETFAAIFRRLRVGEGRP